MLWLAAGRLRSKARHLVERQVPQGQIRPLVGLLWAILVQVIRDVLEAILVQLVLVVHGEILVQLVLRVLRDGRLVDPRILAVPPSCRPLLAPLPRGR